MSESEPDVSEATLKIASDIHRFDAWQGTFRFTIGAAAVCFIVWKLCDATVQIASIGKSFWELFFAWLPGGTLMFFGIYRFRRRLVRGLQRLLPYKKAAEQAADPTRESSNLLEDGTHPNDD